MSDLGSRFISEKDVEERKKTQESEGVTEAPIDARSLYERLQVEKERKQEEYEAFSSLKNRVHRLDEEEVEYLKTVAVRQQRVEMENEEEVAELLREAKTARPAPMASNAGQDSSSRRPTVASTACRNTQRSLLSGILKRSSPPRSDTGSFCSTAKRPNSGIDGTAAGHLTSSITTTAAASANAPLSNQSAAPNQDAVSYLPGLASYCISDSENSSEDSDNSASTDVEDAACTLMEISSTRSRKQKTCSSENS